MLDLHFTYLLIFTLLHRNKFDTDLEGYFSCFTSLIHIFDLILGVCLLLQGLIMLLQYMQNVISLFSVVVLMLLVSMICMFLICKL